MNAHTLCSKMASVWPRVMEVDPYIFEARVRSLIEHGVHELAHAVTFGINPIAQRIRLSSLVSEKFHDINSRVRSDVIEIEGLAIEVLVLPKLIRMHDIIVKPFEKNWIEYLCCYALTSMRSSPHIDEVIEDVERLIKTRRVRLRAAKVLRIIEEATA